jgi:hypothetical protein
MPVVPGDLVRHQGREMVVVDVSQTPDPEPDVAVLRDPADLTDPHVVGAYVDQLEVVRHLTDIPGWVETEHGQWAPSPFGTPA